MEKLNFAAGGSSQSTANFKDEHGIRVSFSIKICLRLGQSKVDGRPMDIDSGGECQAPHFGNHVDGSSHCSSRLPGGQSIFGAVSATRRRSNIAIKVACDGCTWRDTKVSTNDVTIKGTSTGGC